MEARRLHEAFSARWGLSYPIHSVEVRGMTGNFLWLRGVEEKTRRAFLESLYGLMKAVPVLGLACVIDRPGYNARYLAAYGRQRWSLCRTAFSVVVERAAKQALIARRRLRVMPEKCNKKEDRVLRGYFEELLSAGMPFSVETSAKYSPMTGEQLRTLLYEFRLKEKSSPMAQLADLYLWPIAMGGYHASNLTYKRLLQDGKLIECVIPEAQWRTHGSKYSCFDLVKRKL